jgi:hypothetical protein
VSGVAQEPVHICERIEIPQIKPDVTQLRLHAGDCRCCAKRLVAEPPGLELDSPFGPTLRAFAIYNICAVRRRYGPSGGGTSQIRARLSCGTVVQSG